MSDLAELGPEPGRTPEELLLGRVWSFRLGRRQTTVRLWLYRPSWTRVARRKLRAKAAPVSCDCGLARPSERDLSGHRHDCPFHPPKGWPHGQPVARVQVVEDEHGIQLRRVERPAERQLVRDPLGKLWLLDDVGRVNREVSYTQVAGWGEYRTPSDIRDPITGMTVHTVAQWRGIPYRIRLVDWAEFVRLGGPPKDSEW